MSRPNVTRTTIRMAAGLLAVAAFVAACSGAAAAPYGAAPTQVAAAPTQAAAAPPVVAGATSTVMAVYTFASDTAGSGKSACSGGCLTRWPAVTVAAGATPTAGNGVSGTLATITRADNGSLQVTYNGLPLYFYAGDKAPGDTNGSYTNWNLVKP
jgi:predicted lipoprotein with Yx(FWY)xxD motif